jgi:hypothetical protein
MAGGIMQGLRKHQHCVTRWVVAVLLLPLLLGLLPPAQVSAAEALDRDIAASRCLEGGTGLPSGQGDHRQHQDHCILCAAGTHDCGMAFINASPAFDAVPERQPHIVPLAGFHVSTLIFFQDGNRPRGPPAVS